MSRVMLAKNRTKSTTSWDDIPEAVAFHVAKRVGQPTNKKPKFVAAGSQGSVYSLESGDILKITSDSGEAHAAAIIEKTPSPNVYTVLDSFEIESAEPLYGILMPDMDQPDPEWLAFGDIFNNWHTNMTHALEKQNSGDQTNIYLLPPIIPVFRKYIEKQYGNAKFKEQLEWLQDVTEYLLETEILFLDVHGGNIMKIPHTGKHVLIDVGYSETPPVELETVTAAFLTLMMAKKLIITAELLSRKTPKNRLHSL